MQSGETHNAIDTASQYTHAYMHGAITPKSTKIAHNVAIGVVHLCTITALGSKSPRTLPTEDHNLSFVAGVKALNKKRDH